MEEKEEKKDARQEMAVDIACVGFGPAMGGFLTTLSRGLVERTESGGAPVESKAAPGMPLQVVCYERADDVGFGVSGVATRARGIRASFPDLQPSSIPMAHEVKHEKLVYLMDPLGASRRTPTQRATDAMLRVAKRALPVREHALELPIIPPFLKKDPGLLLSIGQFNQWVASQLLSSGQVQIWPGTPVSQPLFDGERVVGIRLVDQGTDAAGNPEGTFSPGMDVKAALTVVGDGPVGPVGRQLDEKLGLPQGHHQREWAVGMKMVVELAPDSPLQPGMVIHTFGYPEPEIFGFLYVYADRSASLGIFVPSWHQSPIRTSYRYLQHWMMHPYLWPALKGGTMRSWGAKTLQESGRRGEPHLVGDGFARIGEGSGTTNVLSGSGVDEAWTSGVQLAEGVLELLAAGREFTKENLEKAYVRRRRQSWLEDESLVAEKSRDGFRMGLFTGLLGMGLTGFTGGMLNLPLGSRSGRRPPSLEEYYRGRISTSELAAIRKACAEKGESLHDAVMDKAGWPAIPFDGKLLVTQQDALLMGGKVQAPPGYANHVVFVEPRLCQVCDAKVCIEVCSGQAITPGDGVPRFDREKCIHCGACIWSCTQYRGGADERGNIEFRAGAGGLHSAEN
jgi:electron-transferring-flavoprotein dehydrogenase